MRNVTDSGAAAKVASRIAAVIRAIVFASMLVLLAACSGRNAKTCDKPREYKAAESIPALQVPEDLDALNSAVGLTIPDVSPDAPPIEASLVAGAPCLEAPPDFFDTSIN